MAVVKEGILLASIKSDLITGITVGSSDAANLVLTEGCRRISVYNVRIHDVSSLHFTRHLNEIGTNRKYRGPQWLLRNE